MNLEDVGYLNAAEELDLDFAVAITNQYGKVLNYD